MRNFFFLAAGVLALAVAPAQACHWCGRQTVTTVPVHLAGAAYVQPSYFQAVPMALGPSYYQPAAALQPATAQLLWLSVAPPAAAPAAAPAAPPIDTAALRKLTADLETLTRTVSGLTATADDHEARLRRMEAWAKDAKQSLPLK